MRAASLQNKEFRDKQNNVYPLSAERTVQTEAT